MLEGTGGLKSLSEGDKADIKKTIDKDVLKGTAIEFLSSEVREVPGGLSVRGELSLNGRQAPVTFDLAIGAEGAHDRQCQGDPERVRDEAVLGAVRGAQGRRRRRG